MLTISFALHFLHASTFRGRLPVVWYDLEGRLVDDVPWTSYVNDIIDHNTSTARLQQAISRTVAVRYTKRHPDLTTRVIM